MRWIPHVTKCKVVILRYGELGAAGAPMMSYAKIARTLRLVTATVQNICDRYVDAGNKVLVRAEHNSGPPRKFTAAQVKELVSEDLLAEWAPLTLAQRAYQIKLKWNVDLSIRTVAKYYHENRIGFT